MGEVGRSEQDLYVDADPDLFRWVLIWYNRGAPMRLPATVNVFKLRREFEALGIRLKEEDLVQEMQQAPHADQADILAEEVKALRLRLCAVQLARAVAASLAKRPWQNPLGSTSSPATLTINTALQYAVEDTMQSTEWLLEDESIVGLDEAGLTADFDWGEVYRHPSLQEALKQQGLMCSICHRTEISAFELTVMPL